MLHHFDLPQSHGMPHDDTSPCDTFLPNQKSTLSTCSPPGLAAQNGNDIFKLKEMLLKRPGTNSWPQYCQSSLVTPIPCQRRGINPKYRSRRQSVPVEQPSLAHMDAEYQYRMVNLPLRRSHEAVIPGQDLHQERSAEENPISAADCRLCRSRSGLLNKCKTSQQIPRRSARSHECHALPGLPGRSGRSGVMGRAPMTEGLE